MRLQSFMSSAAQRGGQNVQLDINSQQQATKLLNFMSGALQLMPIELCGELSPKVLRFCQVEDSQVKVRAYLTIEVLYASRRFENDTISTRTLKSLLDNAEII